MYGGDWNPSDENSMRFLGEPNTVRENKVNSHKGASYTVEDKYNEEGKAIRERHYTDHNRSDKHTNPHDHEINWDSGEPKFSSPIDYPNDNPPEFKHNKKRGINTMSNQSFNYDIYKFESLAEARIYLNSGANLGFEYNGIEYGIEGHENSFDIWIYNKGDIANGLTLDEVMDYEFGETKFKDFIIGATIIERLWK